ncbi:Crp/Fnr family transcriptional regulator [Mucilaginibacter conchicola]|uniref:Crp/Fnr family transcriptional regulator n=1 Tax=Mucilaginibacter conchicola TaxID=2303333 RepID=A0A372NPV5_9SPHI|nr:Crp/Fnr family transcriptional regulator [Mucilaginibacter conchicola]RFZ90969.1 Crp/Fnr family transcriptional regulator [Mucilaginibacter conchicola]
MELSTVHPLRKHIEAVTKLTDEEFEYILSHFTEKKIKKHGDLIREGEYINHEYYVLQGCLRTYFNDPDAGKEYTYQFAVEDWWLTDREAFLNGTPAKMTIECLEPCVLLSISKENREKLGREMWKYEHYLNVKSNIGYVALQKRMLGMITKNAKERYETFLEQYPHLANRIPKTYIASYLGVSRETISRLYRQ